MPVPDVPRDNDVISEEDLQTYANHLKEHTFFGPDSWYMNHNANAAYAATKLCRSVCSISIVVHVPGIRAKKGVFLQMIGVGLQIFF